MHRFQHHRNVPCSCRGSGSGRRGTVQFPDRFHPLGQFSAFVQTGKPSEALSVSYMGCEYIQLKTKDGVELYGTYVRAGKDDAPAVVLLHMMPATKESWEGFQQMLADSGFQSLAIDLRGHGESVFRDGELLDYQAFTPEEHRAK